MRWAVRAFGLVAVSLVVMFGGGCGDGDGTGATTAAGETLLNVTVWPRGSAPTGDPAPETFVATCTSDNTSADCERLRGLPPEVLDGPVAEGTVCIQQYGGPQLAEIDGVIAGRPVQLSLSRVDGCQIERWDALIPLLRRIAHGTPEPAKP